MGVATAPAGLTLETISSENAFAALGEDEWDRLVRSKERPSPFLLHAWLLEWWRHYGADSELAVQVAYRGGRLVGALPMCVRRRYGLRVLSFVGLGLLLLAGAFAYQRLRSGLVTEARS